jgi:hypothetical protein
MAHYNDFIHDFPARCGDVLKIAYDPAKAQSREVTLLIMAATAAFLFPFERLRSGSVEHQAGDRKKFPELTKHLDSSVNRKFYTSPFYERSSESWLVGRAKSISQESELKFERLPSSVLANEVLAIIRNALAHGNLWTLPGPKFNAAESFALGQIDRIIFWSEDRKNGGYKYVSVSPDDFYNFLMKWLQFLEPDVDLKGKLGRPGSLKFLAETLALTEDPSGTD